MTLALPYSVSPQDDYEDKEGAEGALEVMEGALEVVEEVEEVEKPDVAGWEVSLNHSGDVKRWASRVSPQWESQSFTTLAFVPEKIYQIVESRFCVTAAQPCLQPSWPCIATVSCGVRAPYRRKHTRWPRTLT